VRSSLVASILRKVRQEFVEDHARCSGCRSGVFVRRDFSLSILSSRPFRLINIRMGRRIPGLMPQHLPAMRAAAAISGASVSGDDLGSTELVGDRS